MMGHTDDLRTTEHHLDLDPVELRSIANKPGGYWAHTSPEPLEWSRAQTNALFLRAFDTVAHALEDVARPTEVIAPSSEPVSQSFLEHAGLENGRRLDFENVRRGVETYPWPLARLLMHVDLLVWARVRTGTIERGWLGLTSTVGIDREPDGRLYVRLHLDHAVFAPWVGDYDNREVADRNRPVLARILGRLDDGFRGYRKTWGGIRGVGPDGFAVETAGPADLSDA